MLACWGTATASAQSLTEDDHLAQEMPVVLHRHRLQQSLHDVPGAMTVIDRETIRQSGARDVAELLRLVPGYMVVASMAPIPWRPTMRRSMNTACATWC